MNLFEIPTAADLRAFAGMPALRSLVATLLYVAQAENDSSEAVIDLSSQDQFTPDMIEAVAAEMREKGYTVVVDVDELAVTWGEDLLG